MALDGIMIAALTDELSKKLTGGRIVKIAQPEPDELFLTVKKTRSQSESFIPEVQGDSGHVEGDGSSADTGQYRLKLSASATLPYAALTDSNKQSPMTAPNFCMLLRKHLQNGRITAITQPGLERAINITVEHLNEMGDICHKTLIIELMGKHSNIILVNEEDIILDSIKHISAMVSSVREVLPGKTYFIPKTQEKLDPLSLSPDEFKNALRQKPMSVSKALYSVFTGFSPLIANELVYRAGTDPDIPAASYSEEELMSLFHETQKLMDLTRNNDFTPTIVYEDKHPLEFYAFALAVYTHSRNSSDIIVSDPEGRVSKKYHAQYFGSVSEVLNTYYSERDSYTRMRQKSQDLRKIVHTHIERNAKKLDIQKKQLKDTDKMDKYRIYGELINTYGYDVAPGSRILRAENYYDNSMVEIPLDENLSPKDNAKKYFDRYSKLKRTREAVTVQLKETDSELSHLNSILTSLELAEDEATLGQIKEELIESGYIKRHDVSGKKGAAKRNAPKSRPFHYRSSDGFDIYVGKNNYQNDQLTFSLASGNDWWFHAKKIPGSHVILKTNGAPVPDRAFEEAGALAAYYSKGQNQNKVEVDYVERKQIKKPSGGKPGFVIYYTNYSLTASTDISALTLLEE
ncbi:MAG: NFACT family protein [Lachnospiraceae bacterium]|nr:NFACT family protein [Lachnospiraceae bacterium]